MLLFPQFLSHSIHFISSIFSIWNWFKWGLNLYICFLFSLFSPWHRIALSIPILIWENFLVQFSTSIIHLSTLYFCTVCFCTIYSINVYHLYIEYLLFIYNHWKLLWRLGIYAMRGVGGYVSTMKLVSLKPIEEYKKRWNYSCEHGNIIEYRRPFLFYSCVTNIHYITLNSSLSCGMVFVEA